MKLFLTSALAGLGLALAPLTSLAALGAEGDDVEFSEAMACSSLYTVLAAAVEGEPEYGEFVDISARWLIIASNRYGGGDLVSEATLQEWVSDLLSELEAQPDDETREAFLFEGIDICEANYQSIAEEFDSIDMG